MTALSSLIIPAVICLVSVYALAKGTDVFSALTDGALEGLRTAGRILPALAVMLTAVSMLRVSGVLDAITYVLSPVFRLLGIPPETAMLVFLRPLSGSGALAAGSDIISAYGPDSLIGRTAAVMLGSTETTFYVAAVYLGAAGVKNSRYAIPAALCADLAGFITASACVRMFYN